MKYLESYKSNLRTKSKVNVDLKNKFISGQYMIFTCEDIDSKTYTEKGDILYLGKIGNIEHSKEERSDGEIYNSTYLGVLLLDFIMEVDLPIIQFSEKKFNLNNKNNFKQILFKSNSFLESQKKFDELKEQVPYSNWIIKQDTRKYNI